MKRVFAFVFALPLALAPAFGAEVYVVDKARPDAKFEFRCLLSTISGSFKDIDGAVDLDPANPAASSVEFSAGERRLADLRHHATRCPLLTCPTLADRLLLLGCPTCAEKVGLQCRHNHEE